MLNSSNGDTNVELYLFYINKNDYIVINSKITSKTANILSINYYIQNNLLRIDSELYLRYIYLALPYRTLLP